jgi:hypothetical protein
MSGNANARQVGTVGGQNDCRTGKRIVFSLDAGWVFPRHGGEGESGRAQPLADDRGLAPGGRRETRPGGGQGRGPASVDAILGLKSAPVATSRSRTWRDAAGAVQPHIRSKQTCKMRCAFSHFPQVSDSVYATVKPGTKTFLRSRAGSKCGSVRRPRMDSPYDTNCGDASGARDHIGLIGSDLRGVR